MSVEAPIPDEVKKGYMDFKAYIADKFPDLLDALSQIGTKSRVDISALETTVITPPNHFTPEQKTFISERGYSILTLQGELFNVSSEWAMDIVPVEESTGKTQKSLSGQVAICLEGPSFAPSNTKSWEDQLEQIQSLDKDLVAQNIDLRATQIPNIAIAFSIAYHLYPENVLNEEIKMQNTRINDGKTIIAVGTRKDKLKNTKVLTGTIITGYRREEANRRFYAYAMIFPESMMASVNELLPESSRIAQ